ncbi:retrotransposon protein, putative, ty1-copia subclass [Tanacetum coccineum]
MTCLKGRIVPCWTWFMNGDSITPALSFGNMFLESARCILNIVSTKKVDKTPYELWYGKVPNLSYLKVWGCETLVKRDTPDKLQERYIKCIFIGYPKETMGYYFYFLPENKIVVARYAEFLEKNLISQEEMQSIKDNQVWRLVDLPPNSKTIGSKWLFKKKTDYSFDLNKTQGASTLGEVKCMKNVPYASVVESIMYAVRCTRPDVAFANTKDMFLVYGGNPEAKLRVDCYCNAGFETDRDDIKSQTRYIFVLNGGTVD